jgi:hypothetical protein
MGASRHEPGTSGEIRTFMHTPFETIHSGNPEWQLIVMAFWSATSKKGKNRRSEIWVQPQLCSTATYFDSEPIAVF